MKKNGERIKKKNSNKEKCDRMGRGDMISRSKCLMTVWNATQRNQCSGVLFWWGVGPQLTDLTPEERLWRLLTKEKKFFFLKKNLSVIVSHPQSFFFYLTRPLELFFLPLCVGVGEEKNASKAHLNIIQNNEKKNLRGIFAPFCFGVSFLVYCQPETHSYWN